jgi:hypothetical protein
VIGGHQEAGTFYLQSAARIVGIDQSRERFAYLIVSIVSADGTVGRLRQGPLQTGPIEPPHDYFCAVRARMISPAIAFPVRPY